MRWDIYHARNSELYVWMHEDILYRSRGILSGARDRDLLFGTRVFLGNMLRVGGELMER